MLASQSKRSGQNLLTPENATAAAVAPAIGVGANRTAVAAAVIARVPVSACLSWPTGVPASVSLPLLTYSQ